MDKCSSSSIQISLLLHSTTHIHIFRLVEGHGDVTYNSCRSLLAAPSAGGKIAYNLFKIDPSTPGNVAKLYRKSEWPTQCLKTDGKEPFHCLLQSTDS